MRRTLRRIAASIAIAAIVGAGVGFAARAAQESVSGSQAALNVLDACPDRARRLVVHDAVRRLVLGRWVVVEGPAFASAPGPGGSFVVAHAVDPDDPRRVFASDGFSIQRSADAGCTWREVYRVEPAADESVADVAAPRPISSLHIPRAGSGRVYALVVEDRDEGPSPVRVAASDDSGEKWRDSSEGLPPASALGPQSARAADAKGAVLAVAPGDANRLYLALNPGPVPAGLFYASRDGGRTWESRAHPNSGSVMVPPPGVREIAVDPGDPESVWVYGDALVNSPDGGSTWTRAQGEVPFDHMAGLSIWREARRSAVVQVLQGPRQQAGWNYDRLIRSASGTRGFVATRLAQPISAAELWMEVGQQPDDIVAATARPDRAYRWLAAEGRFLSLEAEGLPAVAAPQADRTASPAYWFRTPRGLAAFVPGDLPRPRFPPPPIDLPVRPAPLVGQLDPKNVQLRIERGAQVGVAYKLTMPPRAVPVDVWFLVDTSGSMEGAINALRDGLSRIVADLRGAGMDAWFGLAEYKGDGSDGEPYRYKRLVDVSPPGAALTRGLAALRAVGGGEESQLTALYQTATGRGQPEVRVAAGQQASFRPTALKVIVHASDEKFGFVPDGPTREEAVAALRARGVHHIGLDLAGGGSQQSVTVPPQPQPPPNPTYRDLADVSAATGTYAPPGGVDCDADGNTDLDEGDPLTCTVSRRSGEVNIVPAIVSAVRALRETAQVGLVATPSTRGSGVTAAVDRPPYDDVDLFETRAFDFVVLFGCPAGGEARRASVQISGIVRSAPVAVASASVTCVGLPRPPPPSRPSPALAVPATPPQVVPQLEPAPTPQQQPVPGQVVQPAPAPGVAVQPGQVQVATVKTDTPPRDSGPSPATTTAAGMIALGGGWLATRRRDRTAQQRN